MPFKLLHGLRPDPLRYHLRAIKPSDPCKLLNVGGVFYLLLLVKGGAYVWRLSCSIHGLRRPLSLVSYLDAGLALARKKLTRPASW